MRNRITTALLLVAFLLIGSSKAPSPLPRAMTAAAMQGSTHSDYLPIILQQNNRPFLARNVIVMIGDGMGFEHIKAGSMFLNGTESALVFETFPYHAQMTTASETANAPTDSAAAATAMATGEKVSNYVVSQDIPGDTSDMYTLLEYARDNGLSTGLVTSSFINDATPASFGAHTSDRKNREEIASDFLNGSRPNVLLGGGDPAVNAFQFLSAGYTVVIDKIGLTNMDTESRTHVYGQFGSGYMPYEVEGMGLYPHLSEMAGTALNILDNDPDGFFVMIEGGLIDVASHGNKAPEMVGEVVEFNRTVQVALDWAANHPDTLIVVMADHETGGLEIIRNAGAGQVPEVGWSTNVHTAVNVGVWMYGPAVSDFPTMLDNTQIPALLTGGKFPGR